MKVETITVECQITRSKSYQSARVGLTMEVSLTEGETRQQAIEKAVDWGNALAGKKAEEALEQILTSGF